MKRFSGGARFLLDADRDRATIARGGGGDQALDRARRLARPDDVGDADASASSRLRRPLKFVDLFARVRPPSMRAAPQKQDVTVWGGSYPFVRDDPFFARLVRVGQKYVDEKARGRLRSESGFVDEMAALRATAPPNGTVLVDEMEHRWSYPDTPPTLYVLTMEVFVASDEVLIAGDKRLGRRAQSIKVGEAARSLAPRLSTYAGRKGVRGAEITEGSLVLRGVVYGRGPSMFFEREIQRYTRSTCVRLEVEYDQDKRRRVTSESYRDGRNLVEGIVEFARAHPAPSGHT